MSNSPEPLAFTGNPLDRANNIRRDEKWLKEQLESEESRFLPVWKLNVLVKSASAPELAWARKGMCESMNPHTGAVLLGLREGIAHFAVDVSSIEKPEDALGLNGVAHFAEPRATAATLPHGEAGIMAQARSLIDWHARHRFCPKCGSNTSVKDAGHMRECDDCDAEHFPRTDPVVIMLVESGERCLLGRQAGWPPSMFSALAGFVEHGETLEEAVRREVHEESGIEVGDVRYHASQPWPFPSSLMMGCMARALSEKIVVDRHELEDARWFEREKVLRAVREPGSDKSFFVPPPMAIAHELIRAWAES
ncbi:MAG: NAD(+) diphosphatase [bacterium]|nr:NAD(+) diphosphatase [bacterium]